MEGVLWTWIFGPAVGTAILAVVYKLGYIRGWKACNRQWIKRMTSKVIMEAKRGSMMGEN
jgi:hypothetical protein